MVVTRLATQVTTSAAYCVLRQGLYLLISGALTNALVCESEIRVMCFSKISYFILKRFRMPRNVHGTFHTK